MMPTALLFAAVATLAAPPVAGESRPVSVVSASIEVLRAGMLDRPGEPPTAWFVIKARGRVTSGGWTNPRLVPRGTRPKPDGYLEFDFVGDPPGGITLTVMTPVDAAMLASPSMIRGPVRGVRVYGLKSKAEARIGPR